MREAGTPHADLTDHEGAPGLCSECSKEAPVESSPQEETEPITVSLMQSLSLGLLESS